MMIAGRTRRLAGVEVDARRPAQGADDRLEQRSLDALAAAGAMSRFEGQQDALRRVDAAEQIADRDTDAGRSAGRRPGHAHQAGEALRDLIEARRIAHRATRAEPRDAAGD